MSTNSRIEWTDATWNPIVGCSHVSPGCDHCYAERMAGRLAKMGLKQYQDVTEQHSNAFKWRGEWNGKTAFVESELEKPLHWRKPRRIFVCSMGDLFHETVPFEWIEQVFNITRLCWNHTFQMLTKRPQRVLEYWAWRKSERLGDHMTSVWPENVWLGVTAENQEQADARIPLLLQCPAARRFVSAEPMLGPIILYDDWFVQTCCRYGKGKNEDGSDACNGPGCMGTKIDQVIAGGETGPGARPMPPDWARALRDQCVAAGVPFFFKHWGESYPACLYYSEYGDDDELRDNALDEPHIVLDYSGHQWRDGDGQPPIGSWIMQRVGKSRAGRLLDGRTWDEMPKGKEDNTPQ
jgi:protein gp37